MPDQGSSWGMRGIGNRALELPNGTSVAVSPDDRARIRYNQTKLQLEQSIDQGSYIPLTAVPAQSILSQSSWYISTSGSDSNDGATASTALRTHAELMRRVNGGLTNVSVTVNILDDALASEECHVVWNIGVDGSVRYVGTVLSVLESGTLTGVTNINKGLNIPFDITDTNLSDTWANLGLINQRIRISGGAREGAIAWLAKDLGAKKARASEWKVSELPIASQYSTVNAQVGDPYVVESLPSIQRLRINTQMAMTGNAFTDGKLLFEGLEIGTDTNVLSNISCDQIYGVQFLNCYLVNVAPYAGGMSIYNCQIRWLDANGSPSIYMNGGLITFACSFSESSFAVFIGVTCQVAAVSITHHAVLEARAGSGGDTGGIGIFDQSLGGFNISGWMICNGPIYGSSNGGYAFFVFSAGRVFYDNVADLTATAATGDTSIGGTVKTYAALPFFNVLNGACVALYQ
jgi:hypothetical protein